MQLKGSVKNKNCGVIRENHGANISENRLVGVKQADESIIHCMNPQASSNHGHSQKEPQAFCANKSDSILERDVLFGVVDLIVNIVAKLYHHHCAKVV